MAQQGVQMGSFCCSICLDILRDPVTIPCGHNYCMGCIKSCWDGEDQRGTHSCPQCRQTFIPRPAVVKNTMLAELVEELEKTGLQAAPLDHCYAGPGDVACDVCTGRKLKALRFCQVCLVSYCEQHLQSHYDVAPLRKHKLVEASTELQENICSRHDEVMKIFCRTDQQCICYLCAMDEHQGHKTISAATERTERQKWLCLSHKNILERIQKEEKDVKALQQKVENINCSADKAVKNSDRIFTELIRSIERRRSQMKEHIRTRQKAQVSRAEELQKQKKQQITELRRRDAELEQLSHTENHIHFLQKYPSLVCLSEYKDLPSTDICPLRYFEDVAVAMSKTRDKVEDILREVPEILTKVDFLLSTPPGSTTRAEYLKYSRQIKLDPNTANAILSLSEGNRKASVIFQKQLYSHHPERFTQTYQVLSKEGLTGRCYWEVEWSGRTVSIAVSYKNINRGGEYNESRFGNNDKSWGLECSINGYKFHHNRITIPITGPLSYRVGVYLDYRAGTLCFYSVSETMTLLHRVQTRFTQPLYPGFWFGGWCGDTAELCLQKYFTTR
ncbi:E3 ubiquitin/ISG15 ligase TRIM25-like [Polymixia lowei]